MSTSNGKYKKLIPSKIKINHQNIIRKPTIKENETDLILKKIINFLYLDKFQDILLIQKSQFIQNIEKKLDNIVSDNYPEYITIKKYYIDKLKKEINAKYINEYTLFKKAISNYNKNPKLFQLVTNYIPHCPKSEKYAYHNCTSSLTFGKFIKVNDFVICVECKACYKGDLIEMYCKHCKKNYYSSLNVENSKNILNNNKKKLPFATWEKYHCGFIINEIMKCIKCKSKFYYDNINDKLICLNKNCRFEAKPKSIIWKCSICSSEFISPVKAFNPLEIKIYKNSINYALLIKEKARPYKVDFCNFCGGDVSKATFYHKRCGGELLMSKLNNKEVVVCSRCHGMNFYSQYSWACPLCDRKIKNKNYVNFFNSSENFLNKTINNKNNIMEKKIFSQENFKNNNKLQEFTNLYLYKKKNFLRSSFTTINNINKEIKKNSLRKSNLISHKEISNISYENKNISTLPKKDSYFTIKNLFMRNDSNENKKKNVIKLNSKNNLNNESSNNSKSKEKTIKKKSTLFDILQKRYNDKALSSSREIKDFNNKNISNTINSNYSLIKVNNSQNNFIKKNIYGNTKIKPYIFSLKEQFLRNITDNNIGINNFKQKSQANSNINQNVKKNEKIKRVIYQKNIGTKLVELNEEIKKEKTNHIYKSIKYVNNIKNYSLYDKEKDKHLQNRIKIKKSLKNELDKIKIDNKTININNIKFNLLESRRFNKNEKNEIKKDFQNNQTQISQSFRRSFNIFPISNINTSTERIYYNRYTNDLKKNKKSQNIKKLLNNYLLSEAKQKNEIKKLDNNNSKAIKKKFNVKNRFNYSKTIENYEDNKKMEKNKSLFQILSQKEEIDSLDRKKCKTTSKRRYYQNLLKLSKEKDNKDNKNKNIKISNFIDNINTSSTNNFKSSINIDTNLFISNKLCDNNYNSMKDFHIINTNTNANTNTYNDKTNNIKDFNEIDNQSNLDIIDFDEEESNIVSQSKINSIINKDNDNQNNILYDKKKLDEIIQNCSIPKFETNDYFYKDSIGEGTFGTIYEVEEIKTGNRYAIKKIICKDIQDLIKQKAQLELEYSIDHENIMKIYKAQIKCLDFSTYSISILMELAISDWNQEILKRSENNNYYEEIELLSILKQLINGLLFLKNKNIAHRDIKPQNILIFPNNIFKLADLGEAKTIKDLASLRTLKGCELYMSPALYWGLLHGKKNLVHNIFKSDVFSLGYCILYAITLNIKVLEKIRKLDDNTKIRNIILQFINKNIYSDEFLNIICKMVNINEEERWDFENIYKEIENLSKYI